MADLFDDLAERDDLSEDEEERLDEEERVKRPPRKVGESDSEEGDEDGLSDSSEEEDDDEEEMQRVREGFIVSDEEEEGDEEDESSKKRRRKKRRRQMAEDEDLDEEDLDLLAENTGAPRLQVEDNKFKRLKRGKDAAGSAGTLENIFSDEEDNVAVEGNEYDDLPSISQAVRSRNRVQTLQDEFADFIEQDDIDDEEEFHGDKPSASRLGRRGAELASGTAVIRNAQEQLGIDPESFQEAYEIFGDGQEYAYALGDEEESEAEETANNVPLGIQDVFEPGELKERLLTDTDERIRITDEPERYQLLRAQYRDIPIVDIREEADWIASSILIKKAYENLEPRVEDKVREAVLKVTDLIVNEGLEVPFIWTHRKDYLLFPEKDDENRVTALHKLLSQDDLWDIVFFDVKWRSLLSKKQSLLNFYNSLEVHDEIFTRLFKEIRTNEDIIDLNEYLHFQWNDTIRDAAVNGINNTFDGRKESQKRPNQNSTGLASLRNSYGVVKIVDAFGLSVANFADNFRQGTRLHFTSDVEETPTAFASNFVEEPNFPTVSSLLHGARRLRSEEIYRHPVVRQAMRSGFLQRVNISVRPTEKGVRKIDDSHPSYVFKYMQRQTVTQIAMEPALYLQMLKAEEEGLIDLEFALDDRKHFIDEIFEYINSDSYSAVASAWNDLRRETLVDAIDKLLPLMQKLVRESIKSDAESQLARSCRHALLKRVDRAPFQPVSQNFQRGTVPRVMAVSFGRGNTSSDAVFCVCIDRLGRVNEYIRIGNFRTSENVEQFEQLLQRRPCDVIALAGFSVATAKLHDDIVKTLMDRNINISVQYVNDEVARLFHNSARATEEFPDIPPLGRYCVALGRYLQNPLLEYTSLGHDITSLPFHPVQHLLPEELVYIELESAIVDIVNLVGVDVNEAMRDSYKQTLLQYVCGLGPRKAQSVIKRITLSGGYLANREQLIQNTVVTRGGFLNSASFLKVPYDPGTMYKSEILDSTRIHPEDYDLAKKMAGDALELDEEDLVEYEEERHRGGGVIQVLLDDDPNKLDELVLEEYADRLYDLFHQLKRSTLEMIKDELKRPYEELRADYEPMRESQVFTMLTGETYESLQPGTVVPVVMKRVHERFAIGVLDCGVEGHVSMREVSDQPGVLPGQVFDVGQTVQACIVSLDEHKFTVELSVRESTVNDALQRSHHKRKFTGRSWNAEAEEKDKNKMSARREAEMRIHRVIKHPLFRPYNGRQAEEYLKGMQRGDSVVRPSSKGSDHIAITWKVANGVYQHIDVLELDKQNEFSIGQQLRVGTKYIYSDLDELLVSHIKAMARKVDEMRLHEKFHRGTREETEHWLTKYSEANPKRSTYAFCMDFQHPGWFHLCFKANPKSRVYSWPVKVVPNAFELQKIQYADMSLLTNGFKRLYTSMMRSVA